MAQRYLRKSDVRYIYIIREPRCIPTWIIHDGVPSTPCADISPHASLPCKLLGSHHLIASFMPWGFDSVADMKTTASACSWRAASGAVLTSPRRPASSQRHVFGAHGCQTVSAWR